MLASGETQQQIAEYYHCSVDTIQRRMKQYGLGSNTAKNTAKQAAPHGTAESTANGRTQLNVNDNENRKEKENGMRAAQPMNRNKTSTVRFGS